MFHIQTITGNVWCVNIAAFRPKPVDQWTSEILQNASVVLWIYFCLEMISVFPFFKKNNLTLNPLTWENSLAWFEGSSLKPSHIFQTSDSVFRDCIEIYLNCPDKFIRRGFFWTSASKQLEKELLQTSNECVTYRSWYLHSSCKSYLNQELRHKIMKPILKIKHL